MKSPLLKSFSILSPLVLTLLLLVNCEKAGEETLIGSRYLLDGQWEESFRWSDLYNTYYFSKGKQRTGKLKKSILSFEGDSFSVHITPPERKIISVPDTIYVGFSSDTLFTGTFRMEEDSIIFEVNELTESYIFLYRLSGDSLYLSAGGNIDSVQIQEGKIRFFMWGNSVNKRDGIFLRKRN